MALPSWTKLDARASWIFEKERLMNIEPFLFFITDHYNHTDIPFSSNQDWRGYHSCLLFLVVRVILSER